MDIDHRDGSGDDHRGVAGILRRGRDRADLRHERKPSCECGRQPVRRPAKASRATSGPCARDLAGDPHLRSALPTREHFYEPATARNESEANCRRHKTTTIASVVTMKMTGPTNQPR